MPTQIAVPLLVLIISAIILAVTNSRLFGPVTSSTGLGGIALLVVFAALISLGFLILVGIDLMLDIRYDHLAWYELIIYRLSHFAIGGFIVWIGTRD